ncbi:hypothetical protein [Paenibacillus sp. 1001270B_150601_E10]|uniref:hypothetical protein n=1 Tax=Paenibacillus sp. 1001270B_150601_E10 TaxID=2787079 RepID=UPI00189CDC0E|nr:hypothetical protein [Paenibacillus sp. 1001270B_150601_E10]
MVEIPLNEQIISQFCGRPVCVITQDGTRYIGQLSRCSQGKLVLNEQSHAAGTATGGHTDKVEERVPKKGKKSTKHKSKASTAPAATTNSEYGPYGGYPPPYPYTPYPFFGPRVELDLALITLLFLLFI